MFDELSLGYYEEVNYNIRAASAEPDSRHIRPAALADELPVYIDIINDEETYSILWRRQVITPESWRQVWKRWIPLDRPWYEC